MKTRQIPDANRDPGVGRANLKTPRRSFSRVFGSWGLRIGLSLLLSSFMAGVVTHAQVTNLLCEGFEADNDNWFSDSGTWEIGVPTSGPGHAHGGNRCAATILAGNYVENTSSRFEGPPFTVPRAQENPHLRFWHWFDFGCGDYGEVQIKVGNGDWQRLNDDANASFYGYSGGTWSYPSFDLTAYAGKKVQLAFYFSSTSAGCGATVGPGWYIDDVCVQSGFVQPLVANQVESFEGADFWTNWSADRGTWEWGGPENGPGAAHGGSNIVATILVGNYGENTSSRLMSPPVTVPGAAQNPQLRFWHWYDFACGDGGEVQVKAGTNDWQSVASYAGYSGGTWAYTLIDLNPYAGQQVQLGFYFHSSSAGCGGTVGAGWYIDDLIVATTQAVQPLVANQVESFEGADFWTNWSADRGTWEWGVPESGPGAAHGGSNVVATILAGNYGENTSSRLMSPPVTVPAAAQNPQLRFWHWYDFACGDGGEVQIKAGTNDWQSVASYAGYSGGTWAYTLIDLNPYAGQQVQLGFYFYSSSAGCGGTVGAGWYIDELLITTQGTELSNPTDFEAPGFWSSWSSDNGTWEWGTPSSGPGAAHQGTNCIGTILDGNYGENTSSRLISPSFVVPPLATNPRLRFWHWFEFACGDGGLVQIKTGTNDWQALSSVEYVGSSGGVWTQPLLSLAKYAGQRVQLGFWFHSTSAGCGSTVAPGWHLDDLRLIHDPALLLESALVRTQSTVCVSLDLAAATHATSLSFTLRIPPGHLDQLSLQAEGCWDNATITPQADDEWLVTMQNRCAVMPMGIQAAGVLCFNTLPVHSAFVPLELESVLLTDPAAAPSSALAYSGRTIVIGKEPLLEASLGADRMRIVTLYGIPDKAYEISQATSLDSPIAWIPASTNSVPGRLSATFPLAGEATNVPTLYLRALEK